MLIDSHAHLDFAEFDDNRDRLFAEMVAAGISSAIIPGVSPAHWQKQIAIAHQYQCYYAVGVHPWYLSTTLEQDITQLELLLNKSKDDPLLVAIGECGLDKPRSKFAPTDPRYSSWEDQLALLHAQLATAKKRQLPVILHVVGAHNEIIALLKQYALPRGGVIHGFSGAYEIATQYVELGFKLGIGGLILNDNAHKLQRSIKQLPLSALLVETDSPAMAPQYLEGVNTPLTLIDVVKKISSLTKLEHPLILESIQKNMQHLFNIF